MTQKIRSKHFVSYITILPLLRMQVLGFIEEVAKISSDSLMKMEGGAKRAIKALSPSVSTTSPSISSGLKFILENTYFFATDGSIGVT